MGSPVSLVTDDRPKWLDSVGAFVIIALTILFCVITIGPYFGLQPITDDANQKAVVNNLEIAVVAFFIGGSVANRKKDDTLNTVVNTAAQVQSTLTPKSEEPKP